MDSEAIGFVLRSLNEVACNRISAIGVEACASTWNDTVDRLDRNGFLANLRYFQALMLNIQDLERQIEVNRHFKTSPECVEALESILEDFHLEAAATYGIIDKLYEDYLWDHMEDVHATMDCETVRRLVPAVLLNYTRNRLADGSRF